MTFTRYYLIEHSCGYRWWGLTLHPVGACPSCGEENPEWHCIPAVSAPVHPVNGQELAA